MSVLLRQPHGFESLSVVPEELRLQRELAALREDVAALRSGLELFQTRVDTG